MIYCPVDALGIFTDQVVPFFLLERPKSLTLEYIMLKLTLLYSQQDQLILYGRIHICLSFDPKLDTDRSQHAPCNFC